MTTAKIASNAGRTRSKANRPSERRTPRVMGGGYASDFCRLASCLRPFGTVTPPRMMS